MIGFLLRIATGFLLPWLKAIPLRAWLIIGALVAVFVAILLWNHHERAIGRAQNAAQITALGERVKDLATQLQQAQDANAVFNDAVAKLQASLKECESGRRVDAQRAADAKTAYDAALAKLRARSSDSHAQTAKRLADPQCKSWAAEPACGVTVR